MHYSINVIIDIAGGNDAATDVVNGWGLPEGSNVSIQALPPSSGGTIDEEGNLTPYEPPAQPSPIINALNPNFAAAGDPDVTLHVLGQNFTAESVIAFNNADETTEFVNTGELTTVVKTSGTDFEVTPGSYPVVVRSNGQESNTVNFAITEPAP